MKILIVDDNLQTREIIRKSLDKSGHKVVETNNCVDALRILFENGFDLIISGILQPILDGLQFCYRVKTNEKTKKFRL